jgi:hypothetical protein
VLLAAHSIAFKEPIMTSLRQRMSEDMQVRNLAPTLRVPTCNRFRCSHATWGPWSNGTANSLKLISLEIQPSSRDAIEVQPARQGGRNLSSDSSNQLFIPESPVL